MPADTPKDALIAKDSLAAHARFMIPTAKRAPSNTCPRHCCRVSRCGCVAPDHISNSPRSNSSLSPLRYGRMRNRVSPSRSNQDKQKRREDSWFRFKAPACLDEAVCNGDNFDSGYNGTIRPSPSSSELTDSVLAKTEILLKRLSELGLDSIKEPQKAAKDDEVPKPAKNTPCEGELSGKSELLFEEDSKEAEHGLKQEMVEVPLEVWRMMEKIQASVANERDAGYFGVGDEVCDGGKLLRRRSSASSDSTDSPKTELESISNPSSEATENVEALPQDFKHVAKVKEPTIIQAITPRRFTVPHPVIQGLTRFPSTKALHATHRQCSPLGVRLVSPRLTPVTCHSPRNCLTSTTVSQTVNVTTSVQSRNGCLHSRTNLQTATRVEFHI